MSKPTLVCSLLLIGALLVCHESDARAASRDNQAKPAARYVMARSAKAEPGYGNTNSYVMGDQTYTVNDGFRRQLFTMVVQLRN